MLSGGNGKSLYPIFSLYGFGGNILSKKYDHHGTIKENRTGKFIKKLLGKNKTYGIDIDSIYFDKTKNKYVVIEFLHCDTREPHNSHPHYYPFNYQKFCSLWEIAKKLEAEFWLVNFSTLNKYKEQVRLMKVIGIDYDKVESYKNAKKYERPKRLDYLYISSDEKMTVKEFEKVFQQLNSNAR